MRNQKTRKVSGGNTGLDISKNVSLFGKRIISSRRIIRSHCMFIDTMAMDIRSKLAMDLSYPTHNVNVISMFMSVCRLISLCLLCQF